MIGRLSAPGAQLKVQSKADLIVLGNSHGEMRLAGLGQADVVELDLPFDLRPRTARSGNQFFWIQNE